MRSAAAHLKRLREAAAPKLSMRKMAALLGMDPSTYAFYEDVSRSKKPTLTIDFTRKIAGVLADFGVDPDEVMQLAGISTAEASAPALSASEEAWLDLHRQMTSAQRKLVQQLVKEIIGPGQGEPFGPPADRVPTVHSPRAEFAVAGGSR